jgi:hypothetical protein
MRKLKISSGATIYYTKLFLTRGITTHTVAEADERYVTLRDRHMSSRILCYSDVHLTMESARKRAIVIVHAKLQSLEKQHRKLEAVLEDLRWPGGRPK